MFSVSHAIFGVGTIKINYYYYYFIFFNSIWQVLVSTIDFRYITDVITKEEAIQLLKSKQAGKQERIKLVMEKGYPAYTTQVGKTVKLFTYIIFKKVGVGAPEVSGLD